MSPGEVLKMYFERKRVAQPRYSLRALARDLKVSPAYISQVFNSKKKVPETRLAELIRLLDMDDIAVLQLKDALHPGEKRKTALAPADFAFFDRFRPLDQQKYAVLERWYMVALLDLTTLEDFDPRPAWIAKRLGISPTEAELALATLQEHGLLKEVDGKLTKADLKLRFPTKTTQLVIRRFHKQLIKKAYDELDQRAGHEAFDGRLVAGATFALNPAHLALLKQKIQECMYEVSSLAAEGPCRDVYQLNVQFFPLTK